jgi:glycosyltransferase involved in cell wall biosynthesis
MAAIGFACVWDRPPEATWSHTPWQLREALRRCSNVVDIDLTYPSGVRSVLRLAHARRADGRIVSQWKHGRAAQTITTTRLRQASRNARVDAVVEIGDLGSTAAPFYVVQDLSYDVLLDPETAHAVDMQFPSLSKRRLRLLRDRQLRIYAEATGVVALSAWFGRHLVEVTGLPPAKVHVIEPGATAVGGSADDQQKATLRRMESPRGKLLAIGRDFVRKGGEQSLAALRILRAEVNPAITLTVAGPATWPLPGPVPDGVNFVGHVPLDQISKLYDDHDLFVLPSQFEAFGIVFVEALGRGIPCIGRPAYAMADLIKAGHNGEFVYTKDGRALAEVIAAALANDALVLGAAADADEVANFYTWDRAAGQLAELVEAGK